MTNDELELQFYQRALRIFQPYNIIGQTVREDSTLDQYRCIDKNISSKHPYIYGICKLAGLTYEGGIFSEMMYRKICDDIMEAVAYANISVGESRRFFPNNQMRLKFINKKIAQLSRSDNV